VAEVAPEGEEFDVDGFFTLALDNCCRSVFGTVIDEDNLVLIRFEDRSKRFEERFDVLFLIIDGNNDRDKKIVHRKIIASLIEKSTF